MGDAVEKIYTRVKEASTKRIVFAEGEDLRIIEASIEGWESDLFEPVLVGNSSRIRQHVPAEIEVIDPSQTPDLSKFSNDLHALRKHKGMSLDDARKNILDPLTYSYMLLKKNAVDGCVSGACYTTPDVVRGALQIIGTAENVSQVSSFFIVLLPDSHPLKQKQFIFSDCALVVDPDVDQLKQIASASALNYQTLFSENPRVAMLSFSTAGSATHDEVNKVAQATSLLKTQHPDWEIEGEVQLDAAILSTVAQQKISNPQLSNPANVLIFPNLNAGNIGYKIAERFGNALAIGPILQGLAQPANDLSRGCSAKDVLLTATLTALQANQ